MSKGSGTDAEHLIIERLYAIAGSKGGSKQDIQWLMSPDGCQFLDDLISQLVEHRRETRTRAIPAGRRQTGRPFLTVTLGAFKTADEYRSVFAKVGKKICKFADIIIGSISISQHAVEMDLYEVTGAELGFTEPAAYEDIWSRLVTCGFTPCPVEAALAARLRCFDSRHRFFYTERAFALRDSDHYIMELLDAFGIGCLSLRNSVNLFDPACVWVATRSRSMDADASAQFLF